MEKLSKAQEKLLNKIKNAEITTPDKSYGGWMALSENFTSESGSTWEKGKVYGRFNNAASLRCLERKGYIKIYSLEEEYGGFGDIVSIIN